MSYKARKTNLYALEYPSTVTIMAMSICTAFQFHTAHRPSFQLYPSLEFLLSKHIIIYQCSHLNRDCVTFCISSNVHKKCTCVLSLWWAWPIIWLCGKTSRQEFSRKNRKEYRRGGTELAGCEELSGVPRGMVLLIKKRRKQIFI